MEGDILLAMTTSGNSPNILAAANAARKEGIYVAGLTGGDGGQLESVADSTLVVKSKSTARIQETHILVGHILCQLVDYILFQQGVTDE